MATEDSMPDYLFRGSLADIDPDLFELSQIEAERQVRKLILIPSESSAPLAVREALSSAFQNIYAEGYPPEITRSMTEEEILDHEARLAYYRRYSDPRYYKGVEYADSIEALARRRCAEAFVANGKGADEIFVNVQALSGAPANNAVYHALVQPGETVMGMNLLHGGHLTHGSPANRSGKYYNVVQYGVDSETERIDYDALEALAHQHKPRMLIAGFSSYPWCADWVRFREIADAVGAYFLADISHVAGLVAAGVAPSPVGVADVITLTTHKTLCGPRGAAILTSSPKLARLIDRAVFPGEQGGPHLATILGQAFAFKLAVGKPFKALMKQVIVNCVAISNSLEAAGFRIPFGGTETHLMNLDCKSVKGVDGSTLSGDHAARILDLAGIVVNRNTIPGDTSAANPSGIRLGTTWITQRGFKKKDCERLAGIIADVLKACAPYRSTSRRGEVQRTKVDFKTLNTSKIRVRDIAIKAGMDFEPSSHSYPHFYYMDDPVPESPFAILEVEGDRAQELLRWVSNARPADLKPGAAVRAELGTLEKNVDTVIQRPSKGSAWQLTVASEDVNLVLTWLRDLSDGYVAIDPADPYKKAPGPVVIRLSGEAQAMPETKKKADGLDKPWYPGMSDQQGEALPDLEWVEPPEGEPRTTALHSTHIEQGAKMVPFAGWDMPVWYTSVIEEHLATRNAAGLFDVSHMGVYQVEGPEACSFLDCVATNDIASLAVGESLYAQFLDPDGAVIDDTMIYRRGAEAYLVVVNASNDAADWTWLNAVHDGSVRVDNDRPWAKAFGRGCTLRNLRDPQVGAEMRVDIALQGPKSRDILLALGCDAQTAAQLKALPWAGILEGVFAGIDLIVSRTGYTGERVAYELFVHPEKSVVLWKALLEVGQPFGIQPVGLGARDSLRTEAGLPLYGHEMAGDMGLSVGDAGFAAYVKTYKPWFIGRSAFMAQEAARKSEVARFRFDDKGVRMAHLGDPVVDRRGRVIGRVTSCAVESDGYLLGQAYLEKKFTIPGTPIAIFQSASKKAGKAPAKLSVGDRTSIPTPATVLTRFPR
jgi:glycine hydroxymethyltransferase